MVTKANSCSGSDVTYFKVEWIFWEEEDIWWFDISVCYFWLLEMSKHLDHGCKEHHDVFLIEWFFSEAEVGFKIGNSFFHLNIAFLDSVDAPFLFLKDIASFEFNDIGVRIGFNLR